ncbi:DUF4142 domain-containing protein [Actinomadura gamaensis]|uniref:DUF4142 domain-containing protein n=1 Tax=Actinomadura gamaensis TaxID=1763541 RepID=A0ABV9U239_9ACTN
MSIIRGPVAAVAAATVLAAGGCHYGSSSPAARPTSPPASPAPAERLSAQDRTWLGQAHQGNVAEGELGELARGKSGSRQIQSESATLMSDHTGMDQAVVDTAHRLNVGLPTGPTAAEAAQRQEIGGLTGSAFDNELIAGLITDHEQAIGMAQYEVDHGSDPTVVGMARQALPTMQKHLTMLKQEQH